MTRPVVWRWVASILFPEGPHKLPKPYGGGMGGVWETP